jgi:hypothetical protein
MTPCILVEVDRAECCWCLFLAGYFLGLLFDPEDGNIMFLRNAGKYQITPVHSHRCDNLKSESESYIATDGQSASLSRN